MQSLCEKFYLGVSAVNEIVKSAWEYGAVAILTTSSAYIIAATPLFSSLNSRTFTTSSYNILRLLLS